MNASLLTNSTMWCMMVIIMVKLDKTGKGITRSSISFTYEIYTSLTEIALQNRVSIAWIVREAVEAYLKTKNKESNNTVKQ